MIERGLGEVIGRGFWRAAKDTKKGKNHDRLRPESSRHRKRKESNMYMSVFHNK